MALTRWLRPELSRQQTLRWDLTFALLVVPALAVLLLATGAEHQRVVVLLLVWTALGSAVALLRFWVRSRKESNNR